LKELKRLISQVQGPSKKQRSKRKKERNKGKTNKHVYEKQTNIGQSINTKSEQTTDENSIETNTENEKAVVYFFFQKREII